MESKSGKTWLVINSVLSTLVVVLLTAMIQQVGKIDDKIFRHLTNDEIHCPRSYMVSRQEFDLLTKMRDKQVIDIKETVKDQLEQLRIEIRNPKVYK